MIYFDFTVTKQAFLRITIINNCRINFWRLDNMSIKKQDFVLLAISLIAITVLVMLSQIFTDNIFALYLGICMLLLVYVLASYSIIKNFTVCSLQYYSLFGIGIFNIGKFVQFMLDNKVLYDQEDLTRLSFSNDVIYTALLCLAVFVVCIWTVYVIFGNNFRLRIEGVDGTSNIEYNPFFFKVGATAMLSSVPFYFYRLFLEYLHYKAFGYGKIYLSGGIEFGNILVRLSYSIFIVGYLLICSSRTTYKRFVLFSGIVLFSNVLALMKGSRSEIIISIMFFFWFSAVYYQRKIKIRKLIAVAVPLVFVLQAVSQIRLGRTVELKGGFLDLIFSQSVSAYVLLAFIQSKELMIPNAYPYILDPIVNTFRLLFKPENIRGQSLAVISHRFDLGHHITYHLNSTYYLNGYSLGSNAIAELWEFSWLGIILGAILMGIFICYLDVNKRRPFLMFISYIIISYVAMCFRGNFLMNPYDILKYGFVYFILSSILNISKRKRV